MAAAAQDKWTAFIDIDEFLFPKQGGSIRDALAKLDDFSQVSVPWSTFGTSGFKTYQPGFVTKTHVLKNNIRERIYKSIVRPMKVVSDFASARKKEWNYADGSKRFKKGELVHGFQVEGLRATEDGTPLDSHECCYYYPERIEPTNNLLQLNHYRFKSWQDAEEKLKRKNANSKGTGAEKFAKKGQHWTDWDTNHEHDASAYELYGQCLMSMDHEKIKGLEDVSANAERQMEVMKKNEQSEQASPRDKAVKQAPSLTASIETVLEADNGEISLSEALQTHLEGADDLEKDDLEWYLHQQEALERLFDSYE